MWISWNDKKTTLLALMWFSRYNKNCINVIFPFEKKYKWQRTKTALMAFIWFLRIDKNHIDDINIDFVQNLRKFPSAINIYMTFSDRNKKNRKKSTIS